jgi:hypothetical protein
MVWGNKPFTVYHGTVGPWADAIVQKQPNAIDLTKCSHDTDFGRGFYVTRIPEHAILHANQRYDDLQDEFVRAARSSTMSRRPFDPECAAMIEFEVELDRLSALETLAFVQPIPAWLDFVRHCRQGNQNHKMSPDSYYHVVYGPMLAPTDNSAIPNREQIGFHSPLATAVLHSIGKPFRGNPKL